MNQILSCDRHKLLVYSDHALQEMNVRNITTRDVERVVFNCSQVIQQLDGRTVFIENDNKINPLNIVVTMLQSKNVVITAFRNNHHYQNYMPINLTLDQKFRNIKTKK